MKKFACLCLACLLVCGCAEGTQDALKKGVLSPGSAGEVSFVVVSGVASLGEAARGVDPIARFSSNIDRCNAQGVDFAVVLGDVTPLRAQGDDELTRQWDARDRLCRRFDMPHILVPGDGDMWSSASRRQWHRRYGEPYFSWDHKRTHFIVLCSEMPGQDNRIAGEQLAWLEKDLVKAFRAKRTFVFVHRPLWTHPGPDATAPNQWNTEVHPLLAQYGVNTVFAGHQRQYCLYPTRDKVRYVVAGGGSDQYELAGGFDHFVKVDILDSQATLAVVTPAGPLPPQCAMAEPIEMLRRALTATVSAPGQKTGQVELKVSVPNPTNSPAKAILTWDSPGSTWTAAKAEADVPAGGKVTLLAKASYTRLLSLPEARVELQAGKRRLFGWQDILARAIGVAVARRTKVVEIPKLEGIKIGGDVSDWAGRGFRIEVLSTIGRTVALTGVSAPRVRLAWDEKGLLVMVVVHDETITPAGKGRPATDGDSVEICVSSGPGFQDVYCLTVIPPTTKGAAPQTLFRFADEPRSLEAQAACTLTDSGYIIEARLPWSNLDISPEQGRLIGAQVMVNDADGTTPRVRMGWYPLGHPLSETDGFGSICEVRLGLQASPAEVLAVRAGTVLPIASSVELTAPADWDGKPVAVKQGDKTLAESTLRARAGQAHADMTFGLSPEGGPIGTVDIYVDGEKAETVDLGDAR